VVDRGRLNCYIEKLAEGRTKKTDRHFDGANRVGPLATGSGGRREKKRLTSLKQMGYKVGLVA